MIEILNKYRENVLAEARLHNEIAKLKQEQTSRKTVIDALVNQIEELNNKNEKHLKIINKHENKISMVESLNNIFILISIVGVIFTSLYLYLIEGQLPILFGIKESEIAVVVSKAEKKVHFSFLLLGIFGCSNPLLTIIKRLFLEFKYENNCEYRQSKDEYNRIQTQINVLEKDKQQAQAEYDSINEQIKQKEEKIRKLEIENEVLVKKYQDISARNQMNRAITEDGNQEVVAAVKALEQIQKVYKTSSGDKRISFSLFPNILS